MSTLNLALEQLEQIEAPLSDQFWEGVGISVGVIAAVAGIAVAVAT